MTTQLGRQCLWVLVGCIAACAPSSPEASSPGPVAAPSNLATSDIATPEKSSADSIVRAKLIWMPDGSGVPCGILHVATVMQYEVVSVESGSLSGKNVFVAHGCAELPRPRYGSEFGTLTSFRVGDVHRLVLTNKLPENGPTIMQEPALPTFWCKQADLAP